MQADSGVEAMLWKLGSIKVVTLGAALVGAGIMAAFRPPKTKKEMFYQGAVAIASSLLFGNSIMRYLDFTFQWINLAGASFEDILQLSATIHGLVGAFSWGLFGACAHFMDRFSDDPIKTAKETKDAIL